jgi:hypothetical protein
LRIGYDRSIHVVTKPVTNGLARRLDLLFPSFEGLTRILQMNLLVDFAGFLVTCLSQVKWHAVLN